MEKAVTSAGTGVKVTAGDALIRVLQCISSGVLLEGNLYINACGFYIHSDEIFCCC